MEETQIYQWLQGSEAPCLWTPAIRDQQQRRQKLEYSEHSKFMYKCYEFECPLKVFLDVFWIQRMDISIQGNSSAVAPELRNLFPRELCLAHFLLMFRYQSFSLWINGMLWLDCSFLTKKLLLFGYCYWDVCVSANFTHVYTMHLYCIGVFCKLLGAWNKKSGYKY